jgi:hypothetical protein
MESLSPFSSSLLLCGDEVRGFSLPYASKGCSCPKGPLNHDGIVTGTETAFAEKHQLLTWAHELTKSRRKAWHPCFYVVSVHLF